MESSGTFSNKEWHDMLDVSYISEDTTAREKYSSSYWLDSASIKIVFLLKMICHDQFIHI